MISNPNSFAILEAHNFNVKFLESFSEDYVSLNDLISGKAKINGENIKNQLFRF